MNIGIWDSLYNIILLLFWNIIWTTDGFDMVRNPLLSPIIKLQNKTIDFLKPILPFMPHQIIAATAFIFLIVFRGITIPPGAEWELILGIGGATIQDGSILTKIIFSFLSFAIFIFKIWALSLIYIKTKQQASYNTNTDALFSLAKPFSFITITIRPVVIFIFGMLIAYSLMIFGSSDQSTSTLLVTITQLAVLSLSGLVSVLGIIRHLTAIMIIGSLFAAFAAAPQIQRFCREGIDTLIGPMRRHPIRIGMFDLTPIIFLLAIQFAWEFLNLMLSNALTNIS